MIGPIQSQTQTFLPSPEPLSSLAKLSGMLATSQQKSASKHTAGTASTYKNMMPGQLTALLAQRDALDQRESTLQSYAVKVFRDEYHGDKQAFLEGETAKAKDGVGFFAEREAILALDRQHQVNIEAAHQDFQKQKAFDTSLKDYGTAGQFFYDPETDQRIQGKHDDGKPFLYTNAGWSTAQSQRLGIGADGNLERAVFGTTRKTGTFQTELLALAEKGAVNPEKGQFVGKDGKMYNVISNKGTLNETTLVNAMDGLLSPEAKKDMRIQYDMYRTTVSPDAEELKGKSAAEKETFLKAAFMGMTIFPTLGLMQRYSQALTKTTKGSGKGSGDEGKGFIESYADKTPGSFMQGPPELTYDASGNLIYDALTPLRQMKTIDSKWLAGTNKSYRDKIYSQQGIPIASTGPYFYAEDGTPNSTNIFAGTRSFIYSVSSFQESRKPLTEIYMEGSEAKRGYKLPTPARIMEEYNANLQNKKMKRTMTYKQAQEYYQTQREDVAVGLIAVHEDDMKTVRKRLRTLDMTDEKGKISVGVTSKKAYQRMKYIDQGNEKDMPYYLIPVQFLPGNLPSYENTLFKTQLMQNMNATDTYVIDSEEQQANSFFN